MSLEDFCSPWSGHAIRHIPDAPDNTIFDFGNVRRVREHRWNYAGERTIYLAKSQDVALGEYARHFRESRPGLAGQALSRKVYSIEIKLESTINLCNKAIWDNFGVVKGPHSFMDEQIARSVARSIRTATPAQGIFVPSMCFLDNLEKWNLVLFLEKLPNSPRQCLISAELIGRFSIQVKCT
ncbi:RES domain-containing protein [Synechococcus sp. PCC 7336]|uniref:RES domain-containing protein n=1 Tax=Synechococcus sp. PCC 7336 TaxID=195250 RepID=UPI0008FC05D1|nr:RES domain-containing protein [Synechococcus sp. PCC 7336]